MLKDLKKSAKDSIIYGLGSIVIKAVGLILIPLYSNYFDIEVFGVIGLLDILFVAFSSIFGFHLYYAFFRWYWDKDYLPKQKSMFFTVLASTVFIGILLVIIMYFSSDSISLLLFGSVKYSGVFILMVVGSAFQIIATVPAKLMQLQQKSKFYTLTNSLMLLINLVLIISLLMFYKREIKYIYLAQIIGFVVYFIIIGKFILKNIEIKFEKRILGEMFQFAWPFVISSIYSLLLTFFDRFVLRFSSGLGNVGLYTFAYKIANSLSVVIVLPIQYAVNPIIFKKIGEPNSLRFYSKIMTYFAFIIMFFIIALNLFNFEIVHVLTKNQEYWTSAGLLNILTFGLFFACLKDSSSMGLQIKKKTKIISVITIVVSLINIGLNLLLIPIFISYGAATSYFISQFIFFLLMFIFAQKHYPVPYEIIKILKILLIGVVLSFSGILVNKIDMITIRILIKGLLVVSYPFILYFLRFYEDIELDRIKGFLQKKTGMGNRKPGKLDEPFDSGIDPPNL